MPVPLDEEHLVENAFLKKLLELGYRVYRQDAYDPEVANEIVGFDADMSPIFGGAEQFRESFSDVILENELRHKLKTINDWIEKDQISEVIRRIKVPQSSGLIQANREISELITSGTSVSENRKTGEKSPTVKYIDFDEPDNNSFIAISQYKLSITGSEKHIIPDIVIFVNGIPLVVVECKAPNTTDPIFEAFTQILRYSERRGAKEGNQKLFFYNLFSIATCGTIAKYGTITSDFDHLNEWLDTYPFENTHIGDSTLQKQEILIQGMLSKKNFLDIMHTYTIFRNDDAEGTAKIVARYHQFRAVKKIVERLRTGKTPFEKGGIIWHTQGSGKSLTMMFTVRELYHHQDEFGKYKVVFITDRVTLQGQLMDTSKSVGFTVKIANNIRELQELLKTNTPELVMGMIHKFREKDLNEQFPVLNESDEILVMIDEAHRSEYKLLGSNLQRALPNAIRLAFTGTPIDKTEKTFGAYIDKYTMTQSVKDNVTVPIIYEGRVHEAEITDKEAMNLCFEDVFKAFDTEDRELIMGKYTWQAYLEDRNVIQDKARDMIEHYVSHIFVNGFKAQVVACSRLAAMRYKAALDKALEEKIDALKIKNPLHIDIEKLKKVKVGCVFSAAQNDPPEMRAYTDPDKQKQTIRSFKLPFENNEGDVGIIVVQNMLITGFDAPLEQALYLDNLIKGHNLLQAIARVNRVYKNKEFGYVVDYVGVFKHLKEALAEYYEKDISEITSTLIKDEESKELLKQAYENLVELFNKIGIGDFINETNKCIDLLLKDEKRRKEFYALTNYLNNCMDAVLPDSFALQYKDAVRSANFIKETLRNILREGNSIKEASNKIRDIVETYLESKGITPKIAETNLLDEAFLENLKTFPTNQAKTKRLEITIREYISEHYPEDPELYEQFSEKLEKILQKYKENWEEIEKELILLRKEIKEGRTAQRSFGLDIHKEMPIFGILKREIASDKSYTELTQDEIEFLKGLTKDFVNIIETQTETVDFWESITKQKTLRSIIVNKLALLEQQQSDKIEQSSIPYNLLSERRNVIAEKILETAYHIGYGRNQR